MPSTGAAGVSRSMTVDGAGLIVSPLRDAAQWDRFADADPESTFCHQSGWREIMTGVLGHECEYLEARDAAGLLLGILPLVRVRSILGHYLVSVPFVNDGGPLGSAAARERLTAHAVELARESGAGLLELRSRTALPGPVTQSHRKVAVHLALPESVEELWAKTFKAKLRSQIRRPSKEGMTVRCGQDLLPAFYQIFARNMRDLGTPVLPRSFFERLVSVFGARVLFFVVSTKEGKPAAASCCLLWGEEMEVTWASSLREYNPLSPNMLLYATMLEESIRRGMRQFNFGRSTPGAATHRFKQQWGGRDIPLPWAFWSKSGDVGTPSANSPAFHLATAVWRRLPLAVANRLGPVLSRQLP
jgi:serine/alanine adding enzyme